MREVCSLYLLLKWQNYAFKKKKEKKLTQPSVNFCQTQLQTAVERLFPPGNKLLLQKRVLLQTVSCFLAIRMSENLGLFSDLHLLTKMQKLCFLTGKRCEVWSFAKASKLPPPPPFSPFLTVGGEKNCLIGMWIVFWQFLKYCEQNNINRC